MKRFLKTYWKTLLFFAVIGMIGGFCVGLYALDSYPAEMQQEILAQGLTRPMLGVVSAFQAAAYGLILGAIGIALAKKVGLWKDEVHFEKKPLTAAVIVSLIGGLAMILLDIFFFGRFSRPILDSYLVKPSLVFILGSVTYGAVIEEVMLRLFMMSLIPLGNIMPKAQRNSAFGLRTKWSTANDHCWQQSQRIGGYIMVVTGFVGVILTAVLPAAWCGFVMLALIIAMTVGCTWASYRIYMRSQVQ